MSSIKVAVRCRPWTRDDKLGVHMIQNGPDDGEINLLNSDYSTKRFGFNWAWWTAFNWKHHAQSDLDTCESMKLTNQPDVYTECGMQIKAELYDGNAIVLFAYGLSGSGKTFTVFGMDAVDNPESWFHQPTPHPMWGLFPALGYELFQDRGDGWKVSMKYFQNVVDIVRDLMSPTGEERMYKEGMRKDQDGFMDIEWCGAAQLNSWDDLRQTFLTANARKAIAPTQFNHQSTRGHCIMVLDVQMPDPEDSTIKKRGRIYVCDLAGTEPAGDIVYATYEKRRMPDGTIEMNFTGKHRDQSKTKELQDQGKKINLSLSEMAQFFMKMADLFKKKKLKAGVSVPGCNSFFLCKFLKDTLLQSKTYLFCAIRPEVEFLKYTFATLGFAKNASVIKLSPKKATTAMSPAERKLMAELDKYKNMVEELKANAGAGGNAATDGEGGGAAADSEAMAALQAQLEEARAALNNQVEEEAQDNNEAQRAELEHQRQQYAKRGITLSEFEPQPDRPHLINLDEDPFRSKRFLYFLKPEGGTTFGPKCDIAPPSFGVKKQHCTLEPAEGGYVLVGGNGDTFVNGNVVRKGQRVTLQPHDRVAMGPALMIFSFPGSNPEEEIDVEAAFEELSEGMARAEDDPASAGGGEGDAELRRRIAELEEQKTEMDANAVAEDAAVAAAAEAKAKEVDQSAIVAVWKKCKQVAKMCAELDRGILSFDPVLTMDAQNKMPEVAVKVTNGQSKEEIYIQQSQFNMAVTIIQDERFKLDNALADGEEYTVAPAHDPLNVLYDSNQFHLGSAVIFPEYLAYNLPTEEEDMNAPIKRAVAPYDEVGMISHKWEILSGEYAEPGEGEILDVIEENDLIGKPWTGLLTIESAINLPVMVDQAYVQYDFWQDNQTATFQTLNVEEVTHGPTFSYHSRHHVPVVTQDFIEFLKQPLQLHLYVSPYAHNNLAPISTSNSVVRREIGGGGPDANDPMVRITELEKENLFLKHMVDEKEAEIRKLKAEIFNLQSGGGGSGGAVEASASSASNKLAAAQALDSSLNVASEAAAAAAAAAVGGAAAAEEGERGL